MSGEEGLARTLALSEKAMELLHRHGIAPSPPNYELWFCYAEQANADLVAALALAVRQSQVWDWIDLGHGVPAVIGAAT